MCAAELQILFFDFRREHTLTCGFRNIIIYSSPYALLMFHMHTNTFVTVCACICRISSELHGFGFGFVFLS